MCWVLGPKGPGFGELGRGEPLIISLSIYKKLKPKKLS